MSSSAASQGHRQRTLGDYVTSETCQAIADSTGERCQRTPIDPLPYCPLHVHLYDPESS